MARRYAKALVEVAAERGALERVRAELESFARPLREHPELRALFRNPSVLARDKRRVCEELGQRLGLGPLVQGFLGLVLDHGRIPDLGAMTLAYGELMDERLGRVKALVTSAVPLDDAEVSLLADRLRARTGKEVYVERRLDPALLGGIVVRMGSVISDGSVRGQLRRLRGALVEAPAD